MPRDYPTHDARGRSMTMGKMILYAQRIPVADLVEGHTYIIAARNGHVGIYRGTPAAEHSYDLARTKFGSTYIAHENDFDDEHFPTAIPLKDLGPAPEFEDVAAKLAWLIEQRDAREAEYHQICTDARTAYKEHNP